MMSAGIAPTNVLRRFKDWIQQKCHSSVSASPSTDEMTEKAILSYLKLPFKAYDVNIGAVVGTEDCRIRTLSMNENSGKTAIVLLHGLGFAVGMWLFNLDALAAERPVYAIDIPGFGKSSRPLFSKNAQEAEMQIVDCIEAWRKEMKLERMILFGFSFGGYLATSYAISYPERLSHLILLEPWGFPKISIVKSFFDVNKFFIPFSLILGGFLPIITHRFYPLWIARFVKTINCAQQMSLWVFPFMANFAILEDDGLHKAVEYMLHCNTQNPTGEGVILSMSSILGLMWAKIPMCERISTSLDKDVPLTLIYGSKSWLPKIPVSEIQKMRPTSYVKELLIEGAVHECFLYPCTFNTILVEACEFGDQHFNK